MSRPHAVFIYVTFYYQPPVRDVLTVLPLLYTYRWRFSDSSCSTTLVDMTSCCYSPSRNPVVISTIIQGNKWYSYLIENGACGLSLDLVVTGCRLTRPKYSNAQTVISVCIIIQWNCRFLSYGTQTSFLNVKTSDDLRSFQIPTPSHQNSWSCLIVA